jgi:hypothetical protein
LISEVAKRLPDLNLIIFDASGYYSGHCVIIPIAFSTFQKLKNREMEESLLTLNDIVDYENEANPVFHFVDITADCNENVFYLVGSFLKFFRDKSPVNYIVSSFTSRHDTYKINEQLGMELVWEDKKEQRRYGLKAPPRFYEGDFEVFLKA